MVRLAALVSVVAVWLSVVFLLVADVPSGTLSPAQGVLAAVFAACVGGIIGRVERLRVTRLQAQAPDAHVREYAWIVIGACIVAAGYLRSRQVMLVATQAFAMGMFLVYGVPSLMAPRTAPGTRPH